MKAKLPNQKMNSDGFEPVVYANRILNQEIGSDSRGMIVTNNHKILIDLTGAIDAFEELSRNRTIVNLSDKKGWKLNDRMKRL